MKYTQITRNLVIAFATMGLVVPQASVALAAGPQQTARTSKTAEAPKLTDVALTAEGKLLGQVIDHKGIAKGNTLITVSTVRGEVVSKVKADKQGYFAAPVEKGGVYTIGTEQSIVAVRVWTNNSAPPTAHDGLMVVDEHRTVVRGQGSGDYRPAINGAIAGAAIAAGLGVALDYNRSGS
jgi:hypothetical protein